jgi:hypothetical protein
MNCTPAAKCGALTVFVAEQWCDCSDIGHGVRWKQSPCCEVMFIPRRTRVVGRKEPADPKRGRGRSERRVQPKCQA